MRRVSRAVVTRWCHASAAAPARPHAPPPLLPTREQAPAATLRIAASRDATRPGPRRHGRPRPGDSPTARRPQVHHHTRHHKPAPRAPPRDIGRLYNAVMYQDAGTGHRADTHDPAVRASAGAEKSTTAYSGPYAIAVPMVRLPSGLPRTPHRRADISSGDVHARREELSATDVDIESEEVSYKDRLTELRHNADAHGMLQVIAEMEQRGFPPSLWSLLLVLRVCAMQGHVSSAEDLLDKMIDSQDHFRRAKYLTSARSIIATRHAALKQPEKVLMVMGWSHDHAHEDLAGHVGQLNMGRDTYAWGLIMLSLNQLGMHRSALDLLDSLATRGILVTDSLGHLAIEAHGALGCPEEAERVFQQLLDRGITPDERTVGSLLRVLAPSGPGRRNRPVADPARIQQLVHLVPQPSARFLTASMLAFANTGFVTGAENCFEQLAEQREDKIPDERAFMVLMRCYASQLIQEVPENVPEKQIAKWYSDCVRRADKLWIRYSAAYDSRVPSPEETYARRSIFPKYVLIKALGLELNSALSLLREAVEAKPTVGRTHFKPTTQHFSSLLSGVERACDAQVLEDTLLLMSKAGIPMDDACLAAAVCTLVFHGSPAHAAKLTAVYAPSLIDISLEQVVVRDRTRLLRRLELLNDALEQGPLADNDEWVQLRITVKGYISKLSDTLCRLASDAESN
jgi:pentatricopeptide repeat protein